MHTELLQENLQERHNWVQLDVDRRLALKWILEKQDWGVYWIHLGQE
jgi:hypothetical protein